jgi:hypothetical protein
LSLGPVLRVCDSAAARAGLPGGEGGGATTDALLLTRRGGLVGDGSGGDGKVPRAGIGGGGGVASAEGGSARGGGGGGGGEVSKGPLVGVTGGGWQPPRAQATARAVRLTMPPSVVFCAPLPGAASGSTLPSELLGVLLPASPLGAVAATAAQPSSLAASASSVGVLLVLSSASSSALCSALSSACRSARGSVSAAATGWAWWEASSTEGRPALSKGEPVDAPVERTSALGSRSVAPGSLDRAGADSRAPDASRRAAWPGVSAGSAACSGGTASSGSAAAVLRAASGSLLAGSERAAAAAARAASARAASGAVGPGSSVGESAPAPRCGVSARACPSEPPGAPCVALAEAATGGRAGLASVSSDAPPSPSASVGGRTL